MLTHVGGEQHSIAEQMAVFDLAEQTAIAAPRQRRVRPITPQPAEDSLLKDRNTGYWRTEVFFPGQPGGQTVKDPLEHQSVAAVKLYNCKSTRCRDGGCCAKVTDLQVLEVRQQYSNGSATSPCSDPQKLMAVVQAARNDRVQGGFDLVKITLKTSDPVHVCVPAFALIAGYTGSALKKALHDLSAARSGSLVPSNPQLHPREKEAEDDLLVRSYIRDILTSAHEQQPVTSLGCSSGVQTSLTRRPWKVRAVAEQRLNTPSVPAEQRVRHHT